MTLKKIWFINSEKRNSYLFTIGIIFFLSLMFNLFMSTASGDDLTYLNRLNSLGYIKASVEHYNTWSSRIIIEAVLMFFSKYFILWKIVNAAIMTGTIWFLNKFTMSEITSRNLLLSFGLYSMVPLTVMREAGWVATSLNYHWAFFFALVAFYPFYQKLNKKKITKPVYIFSIFSIIYASNQEQINLCFLVFTFLLSIYLIKIHNYEWKLSILSFISVIGVVVFLLSPGNASRVNGETQNRFPEFANFSFRR